MVAPDTVYPITPWVGSVMLWMSSAQPLAAPDGIVIVPVLELLLVPTPIVNAAVPVLCRTDAPVPKPETVGGVEEKSMFGLLRAVAERPILVALSVPAARNSLAAWVAPVTNAAILCPSHAPPGDVAPHTLNAAPPRPTVSCPRRPALYVVAYPPLNARNVFASPPGTFAPT